MTCRRLKRVCDSQLPFSRVASGGDYVAAKPVTQQAQATGCRAAGGLVVAALTSDAARWTGASVRNLRPRDCDDIAMAAITDLAAAMIRQWRVLGGLIHEYVRAA